MQIAQFIILCLILLTLVAILWHMNRESVIPVEFKRVRKEDRYI